MSFDRTISFALILCATLDGCGGATHADGAGPGNQQPPPHGTLLEAPPALVSLVSAASAASRLGALPREALIIAATLPLCDVAVYHIKYATVGGVGEATSASGALMVPRGIDQKCRGARPIVIYAHGTSTDRDFNIADVEVQQNGEGIALAVFFAARGFIVVAPNYAGNDTSSLGYHPFLNAIQQSGDMIDALSAAQSALPVVDSPLVSDSGRLLITGYSEGGYVAMATARAMQAAGLPFTAVAPMSGPYALAAFVDSIFGGQVEGGGPISATLLITGYQRAYGDVYQAAPDVFESQYAVGIDALLPSTMSRSQLYAAGKLPALALFSEVAPAPEFASITPATQPAGLRDVITNAYRLRYLLDAQANPDGGWPLVTTGLPAEAPGLSLRQATRRNDLRNWVPKVPALMCGGSSDPVVFWLNTLLMRDYWKMSTQAAPSFMDLDVDGGATASGSYGVIRGGFAAAKAAVAAAAVLGGATDGGLDAVLEAYHTSLVAPFCFAAVAQFFEAQ